MRPRARLLWRVSDSEAGDAVALVLARSTGPRKASWSVVRDGGICSNLYCDDEEEELLVAPSRTATSRRQPRQEEYDEDEEGEDGEEGEGASPSRV